MGVFGTPIFSDDDALDIRDEYRDLVGAGYSGPEATDKLLHSWRSELDNPVVWLALAATQWKCGRLEDRVKKHALDIIENGSDLQRWKDDDPKSLPKRRQVLEKLRQQLESPPPMESRIPRRYRNTCDWRPGELIRYTLLSGASVLFRVIGTQSDRGGTYPVCELLDWQGSVPPPLPVLKALPIRTNRKVTWRRNELMLGETNEKKIPKARFSRLGVSIKPEQKNDGIGGLFVLWRSLDKVLAEDFGFS